MARPLARAATVLGHAQRVDERLVCALATAVAADGWITLLRAASRFGDWGLSTLTGLILLATGGPELALRYGAAVAIGLVLQSTLKRAARRVRPCRIVGGPPQRTSVPDEGSFPSGHTLHAVLAALAITAHLHLLAPLWLVVALLVAVSRVVLGVHYPSDVLAGAFLGSALALAMNLV